LTPNSTAVLEQGAPIANTASGLPAVGDRNRAADFFGFLPIMAAMPFMYWPRILEGDTQPWVAVAAFLSCFFFWPRSGRVDRIRLYLPILAALSCIAIYWFRQTDLQLFIRYTAIMLTFSMLWIVACRGAQEFVGTAVRWTIGIWFAVGLYQFLAIRLGLTVEFFGRYVDGRGGIPSLTAEASFYGSFAVLQLMYLLNEKNSKNRLFIYISVLNVLLSGSLLAYVFLAIPLWRLDYKYILLGTVSIFLLTTQVVKISEIGLFSRISNVSAGSISLDPMEIVKSDASTNLRVGQAIFTLYENLDESILMKQTSFFRDEYNAWASMQGDFIYTGSDFILVSAGEALFLSGPFGLMLVLLLMIFGTRGIPSNKRKLEKIAVISLCFISPVSFSNPFFVFYLTQREDT